MSEMKEIPNQNESSDLNEKLKILSLERDDLKQKLSDLTTEFTNYKSNEKNKDANVDDVNEELRITLDSVNNLLKEKCNLCTKQEKQIEALNLQVKSLKEVTSITKDLLNIRNMEVQHLKEDIDNMQSVINSEKERHNQIIEKMERGMDLNQKLKEEYQNQLKIFSELKVKYERKLEILTKENERLQNQQNINQG